MIFCNIYSRDVHTHIFVAVYVHPRDLEMEGVAFSFINHLSFDSTICTLSLTDPYPEYVHILTVNNISASSWLTQKYHNFDYLFNKKTLSDTLLILMNIIKTHILGLLLCPLFYILLACWCSIVDCPIWCRGEDLSKG